MTYKGHVKNGVVVLDEPVELPDGAKVEVAVLDSEKPAPPESIRPPTHYERFASVIGKAEGLPPDLARNHDHYLHGLPKK